MTSKPENEHISQRKSLLDETAAEQVYRLFVAVPLWDEFRLGATRYYEELVRSRWPLRWVKPENWHLTLQFLGDVKTNAIPPLVDSLRASVRGFAPFEIELGGIGGFPRVSKARVVWVGVTRGRESLLDLAKSVRAGCVAGGCPGDKKPFEAHLTLARAKEEPVTLQLPPEIYKATWGTQSVDHVALVWSHLQKGGPVYEPIERFPLEG